MNTAPAVLGAGIEFMIAECRRIVSGRRQALEFGSGFMGSAAEGRTDAKIADIARCDSAAISDARIIAAAG
jgi:hypothetical protein